MKKLLKISILAGFVFTLIFTAVGLPGNIKPLLAVQASTTDTALNTAIVNLYDANFALHNTLIKGNGTETVSNPVFTTSNIMPVETNSTYIYNSYLCYLLAYDNAKNFLGSIPSNGNSLFGGVMQIVHETDYTEVIIPQTTTVKYVRAIFNNPGPSPIFYKTTGDFAADIEIMKSAGVNLVDMHYAQNATSRRI
jgi:hypothetical protein